MPDARPDDFLCERCGSNLLGLDPQSPCPECGTGIGHSCVRAGLDPHSLTPSHERPRWWHILTRPRWFIQLADIGSSAAWEFFGYSVLATMVLSMAGGASMFAAGELSNGSVGVILSASVGAAAALIAFVLALIVGMFVLIVLWAAAEGFARMRGDRRGASKSLSVVLFATAAWPVSVFVSTSAGVALAVMGSSNGIGTRLAWSLRSIFATLLYGGPLLTLALWLTLIIIGLLNTRYANSRHAILTHLARGAWINPLPAQSASPPAEQNSSPA